MRRLAIIDLDNTLVAARDENVYSIQEIGLEFDNLVVRPYVSHFINWIHQYFDIILFSTGTHDYVTTCVQTYLLPYQTKICQILHNEHAQISQRLYGKLKHSQYIKNLTGNRYSTIIGIDDQASINMDNDGGYRWVYCVKPFYGEREDCELRHLRNRIASDCRILENNKE
jgi:TFIIF-interacting CTD phosphatase-like protein